jgi:DNA-directed RNA polymerase specialized sigma24 family protein
MENTGFCDLVSPVYVGEDRLLEIESSLAACTAKISGYHDASGIRYRLDFYREFLRANRDGHPCVVGNANIPAEDARIMMTPKEVEGELLAQFSRLIRKTAGRIALGNGMEAGDLTSEAYEAFFRAMLNYTGRTRFCTFLQKCLERNLSNGRARDSLVRVPREVRRLSMRVVGLMDSGRTFDDATAGFSDEEMKRVIAGMRRVQGAGDLQMDESELAAVEDGEKLGWVNTALQGVQFTRLEREALRGFMESPAGVMGLSSNLKGLVNPDAGRPYSRAAVSAAWAQARKKIRLALEAA